MNEVRWVVAVALVGALVAGCGRDSDDAKADEDNVQACQMWDDLEVGDLADGAAETTLSRIASLGHGEVKKRALRAATELERYQAGATVQTDDLTLALSKLNTACNDATR